MELSTEFLTGFMEKLEFPEEAKVFLGQVSEAFERDKEMYGEMNRIIKQFFSQDYAKFEDVLEKLDNLAQKADIHNYTMHLMFFMYSAQPLKNLYCEAGVSEEIFWNSMLDLRYKLMECYNLHGIWGTFVATWYPRFYKMERFGLGRFQYEYAVFQREDYTKNGFTVHNGDRVFNIHIPSSGSMTHAERMDSYKKAYEFFKGELNGKPIVFVCSSWLLYPKNEEILPERSNIVDFMHDFDMIDSTETETFTAAWRIFGKEYNNPIEQWPTDTSLQRAYANWLKGGNKLGTGFGVILFDGEKII